MLPRRDQRRAESAANGGSGEIERARQPERDSLTDFRDRHFGFDVHPLGNCQHARMWRQRPQRQQEEIRAPRIEHEIMWVVEVPAVDG